MGSAVKAGAALAALSVTLVLSLVIMVGGTSTSATPQSEPCVATGVVPTLSAAQSTNAETIVAVAQALGAGEHGAQVALMTAYSESTLENLGPETDNDESLGLFQQRVAAGWGTAAEEQDPTDATTMFIEHLLAVAGWRSVAPWTAAQDVQASAFASGSNYEANWSRAGSFLAAIVSLADDQQCGGENEPMRRRPRRWP
jgi:peptidoglycan DL-endopeptidase CwlO